MNEITYKSKGIVLGNYWGGGIGSYACKTFFSTISKQDLIEQNQKTLENNSLDDGMGFESLKGALLEITTVTSLTYKNKNFINEEQELHYLGELSVDEIDFLDSIWYEE